MFGVQELEHEQVWNASTLNWTHFTFIGLLDQLSLMFAYQSFGERVMHGETYMDEGSPWAPLQWQVVPEILYGG